MPEEMLTVMLLAGAAAAASVVGGLMALWHAPSTLLRSLALGFAGGVLLATVTTDMVPRALEMTSLAVVGVGFGAGFCAIYAFDLFVHRWVIAGEWSEQREWVERIYLQRRPLGDEVTVLAGGTSVEEFVEGLAIGIGVAVEPDLAVLIAVAVAVDNLSEGLSIGELIRAGAAGGAGQREHFRRALVWTGLIGLALLSSAFLGWLLLSDLPRRILGFLLASASGGMLYLTVTDLVPTAQAYHYQQSSALATAAGFLLMLVLSSLV